MSTIQVWAPAPAAALATVPSVAPSAERASAAASLPFPSARGFSELRAYDVESSVLSSNLKKTLADFQRVMDDLPKSASGYCIDEIELNMGFTSKGGIAFFTKLEVGLDAAIKVKIKREFAK